MKQKVRANTKTSLPYTGLHEDLERLERIIVKDLKRDVKSHKEKMMQSHRVRRRLDSMQESARKLVCLQI